MFSHAGEVQKRLQDQLKGNLHSPAEQDIEVILKLHLVLPNAEKKSVASREVTTDNYEECFTLIRESALFEFQSLNIAHDAVSEETTQPDLFGINNYAPVCIMHTYTTNFILFDNAQVLMTFMSYSRLVGGNAKLVQCRAVPQD